MRSNTKQVPITKLLMILIMVVGIVPAACSQVPINGEIMDSVEEIESEYYSNYPENGELTKTFTSKEVFETEWDRIHKGMSPVPQTPDINFQERTVIFVMLETKPSGGFGIGEFSVMEDQDQVVVLYSEVHPGDGCFTTQALTRPYKLVSVPKSDKEIKFMKGETVLNHCNE